jgi:hypothetical protein
VAELASEVVAMRAAIRGLRLELALQQGTEDTAATGGTCGGDGGDGGGGGGGGGGAGVADGDDRVELVLPLRVGRGAGGAPGAAVRPGGWC